MTGTLIPARLRRLAEDLATSTSLTEVIGELLSPEARQILMLSWATDLYWICRQCGPTGQAVHSELPGYAAAEAERKREVLCRRCGAPAELFTMQQLTIEAAEKLLAQAEKALRRPAAPSTRHDTGKPDTYGT